MSTFIMHAWENNSIDLKQHEGLFIFGGDAFHNLVLQLYQIISNAHDHF